MRMMRTTRRARTTTTTAVARASLGRISLALFPFWRLDAKGGEVALLGCSGDLHGLGTSVAFDLLLIACDPFIVFVMNYVFG